MNVATVALLIGGGAGVALFVSGWIYFRRADHMFRKADQRTQRITDDMIAKSLLTREWQRGYDSRNSEMQWYSRAWEGKDEELQEVKALLEQHRKGQIA